MHELPPLIHRERDRMIDVHHTILPLTHRRRPNAAVLIKQSILIREPFGLGLSKPSFSHSEQAREEAQAFDKLRLSGEGDGGGVRVLAPADMICHAAAHLIADGDMAGGLRNLWDIDRLLRQFSAGEPDFELHLIEEAHAHQLGPEVMRALRIAHRLFATPLKAYRNPAKIEYSLLPTDRLFLRRLLARDGWGRGTRPASRAGFYMRSHWLRMPPLMLARHLWTKARR
jgi:hypothetical protein